MNDKTADPLAGLSEQVQNMAMELRRAKSFRGTPNPYNGPFDEPSIRRAHAEWMKLKPLIPVARTPEEIAARVAEANAKEDAVLASLVGRTILEAIKDPVVFEWEAAPLRLILDDGRTVYVDNLGMVE